MKNLIKYIFITLLILFFSLYFSRYNNTYYENKNILTEEAIKQFEIDIKNNKTINVKDYIKEEKNYNNKASNLGLKTSRLIEKLFNKTLKLLIKILGKLDN